jgi:hypothetical protein
MKLSLITVATGKYLEYWMDLARSVSEHSNDDVKISYHIFTDRIKEVNDFINSLDNIFNPGALELYAKNLKKESEQLLLKYKRKI